MSTRFSDLDKNSEQTPPGRVVRAFRQNFGLTLAEVERLTGIDEANLSALENGSKTLGPERAERIAAVFGIHPSVILYPGGMQILEKPELKEISIRSQHLREKKLAAG